MDAAANDAGKSGCDVLAEHRQVLSRAGEPDRQPLRRPAVEALNVFVAINAGSIARANLWVTVLAAAQPLMLGNQRGTVNVDRSRRT
jgi:hypothetical protein